MTRTEIIIDPLGNEVLLPDSLCDLTMLGMDVQEVYDEPSRVIQSPALMIQVSGSPNENYYFRSVGWDNTLLIGTRKINGKWTAHEVLNNPSSSQLRNIYNKGNNIDLIDCKR